jgi:hypothetical protein
MLMDKRTELANAVNAFGAVGRILVGDQIPLGVARDIGGGDSGQLTLVIQVSTAFTTATTGTTRFILASDASAAIAVDGTASEHAVTKAFSVAELSLGQEIHIPLPPESSNEPYEPFLGLLVQVESAATTAGAVRAFLTRDAGNWKSYPAPGQA